MKTPTPKFIRNNSRGRSSFFIHSRELTGEEIEELHDEVFGIVRTQNDERILYEEHQDRYKSETKEREQAVRERLATLKAGTKETTFDNVFFLYEATTDNVAYYQIHVDQDGNETVELLTRRSAADHEKQFGLFARADDGLNTETQGDPSLN